MIEISKLSKSFGKKEVLKNISISLEKGKVYGIVGENGAGKTTLFNCISGLEKHNGDVQSTFGNLKDVTGFLQTEPFFFANMTGNEYLRLFCNARNIAFAEIEKSNIFNLPLQDYVGTYSTGMKKKLALSAVVIQKNAFLILDEPFNGVDIHSNFIITELIKKLRDAGKTILISSHIFSTLSDVCDQIFVLKEGEIVNTVEKSAFGALDDELKTFTGIAFLDDLEL